MAKIFIGVAWPYANGPVHVGHIAGCNLPPDIFARYHRMAGDEVLMVSGSDMHGTPVTVKAEQEGIPPAELAQRYHEMNAAAFANFGIVFDLFLTTEDPTHKSEVQKFFLKLLERGYLYEKEMELPYCPKCARTLPDRYVEGTCPFCSYDKARGDQCPECGKLLDPETLKMAHCKTCGTTPEPVVRKHFFFKLSALEKPLLEWLSDKNYWRPHVTSFARNFIESGLKDRPVTRDTEWGIEIPVPGYEDKRIYVWFEAFMGYYTMAVEWARRQGRPEAWREFWQNPECRHYYFLGKDNVPFHAIFWPAVLMAHGGLNLPYDVPANAFLRMDGEQFSKSRGVTLNAADLLEKYGPDSLRYYISAIMPESRDAEFSWEEFVAKTNNELVATLGNFVHRTLTFTEKNYGAIPEMGTLAEADKAALATIERAQAEVARCISLCEFKNGLKAAMDLAREGNRYFDSVEPWALVKADRARCGAVLHVCLKFAKALAVLTMPYIPHGAARIWNAIGCEGEPTSWAQAIEPLEAGKPLRKPDVIFRKLEAEKKEEASPLAMLDIRAGRIKSAADHPNAEKLVVLNLDVGEERQIVAGIKQHYSIEQLAGKNILVVCNLQPAKLRGVESNGMLLAADDNGVVSLLAPPESAAPGERLDGCAPAAQIDFKRFQSVVFIAGKFSQGKMDIGRPVATDAKGLPDGVVVPCVVSADMKCADPLAIGGKHAAFDKPVNQGAKIR
ncbi:MAG: methionine--tRNA ligase [Methanobacteriota archaeon]